VKHSSERELIARAMGMDAAAPDPHLEQCAACQKQLRDIGQMLRQLSSWEAPEPPANLPDRVWHGLATRLEEPPRRPRRWLPIPAGVIWATAAILLAAGSYWMGRWQRPAPPAASRMAVLTPPTTRTQVLLVVVQAHLDRTQVLLLDLAHPLPVADAHQVNLSSEQQWARELIASNRLYEQGADAAGQDATAHLLAELEPVLLQIAHSPAEVTRQQWRELQDRIAASGILFKVRVADQTLQTRIHSQVDSKEQKGTL